MLLEAVVQCTDLMLPAPAYFTVYVHTDCTTVQTDRAWALLLTCFDRDHVQESPLPVLLYARYMHRALCE